MPLTTVSALAVSLIPAAVIVLYNIMEHGVPGGGSIKNLINSVDNLASASNIVNTSIINSTDEFENLRIKIVPITEPTTTTTTTDYPTTTEGTTTTTVTTRKIRRTTTETPTSSSTTTTKAPPIYTKLPVCCNNVRVSDDGDDMTGNCHGKLAKERLGNVWSVPGYLMSSGEKTKFTIETSSPTCKDGKFIGQLSLQPEAISPDHILPNGMLKYKNEYYHSDEYCIRGRNAEDVNVLDVQICTTNCSNPNTLCVHKCCQYEEIYSMGMKGERGGCTRVNPDKNETIWEPSIYDENNKRVTSKELALRGIRTHVIKSNPTSFRHLCPRNSTTVFPHGEKVADFLKTVLHYPFKALNFMMRDDGWLINPDVDRNIAVSKTQRTTKYCIDGVMNYGEAEPFKNLEEQTVLFLCLGGAEELSTSTRGPRAESLVAASSNNQPVSTSTTTTTTTTTTTSTITTPKPSTTSTTKATTTTRRTTTTTTTPKPTTTTPKPKSTTTTEPPTTTTEPTATTIPTTTQAPKPPPLLPVCCQLNPDANDDDNEITHHCKSSSGGALSNYSMEWTASPNFMFSHTISKFNMHVKPLSCQKWTKAFVHNLGKLLSPTEPVLMPSGTLKMGDDYYRQGEFCVNGIFPNIVEVLVCKTNCSEPDTVCVNKCCPPGHVYSLGAGGNKRGCVELSEEDKEFDPPLYKDMGTKLTANEEMKLRKHLVHKYPPKFQYGCYKNVTLVFPFSSEVVQLMSPLAQINLEFKLRQDGKVIYKHPSIRDAKGELIDSAFSTYNFCVDGIRNFGEPQGPYVNKEDQTILFVCAVHPPGQDEKAA